MIHKRQDANLLRTLPLSWTAVCRPIVSKQSLPQDVMYKELEGLLCLEDLRKCDMVSQERQCNVP